MISPLAVRPDILQIEPGRFELLPGIQPGLVEIVGRLRVRTFPEYQDGPGFHLRAKVQHAYKRMARYSEMLLLAFLRARVEIEHDTDRSRSARHRQALPHIAEGFLAPRLRPLQPVDLTPGPFPR